MHPIGKSQQFCGFAVVVICATQKRLTMPLTGCVSTQQLLSQLPASREKIYIFPAASRPVVSHSGDVPSPETPRHINVKKKSPIAIDIITVCRYNIIKAGEYYEHQ